MPRTMQTAKKATSRSVRTINSEARPDNVGSGNDVDPDDNAPVAENNINNNDDNHDAEDDSETDLNSTLAALRILCKNEHSVGRAIKYLGSKIEGTSEKARRDFSNEIVDLQGLSILVFALEILENSARPKAAAATILGVLVEVTKHVASCGTLADLEAVPVFLASGKKHMTDPAISSDILSILLNMNIEYSCEAVTGDDVIDYCLEVSKQEFPDKMPVLSKCALIFVELTKNDTQAYKRHLMNKGVLAFLTDAYQTFDGLSNARNDAYDYERDVCRESTARLMDWGEKKAKKTKTK